jgi:hypothetical protein
MLPLSFPTSVREAVASEATKKLVVTFDGSISSVGTVDIKLTHKPFLLGTKTVAEMREAYPSPKIDLGMAGEKAALSIDLSSDLQRGLKKKMKLKLVLETKPEFKGDLLNAQLPPTFKKFEELNVELK